jgi:hypothetical protein
MQEDKIQKAKDFLWDHLTELSQDNFVRISQMPQGERLEMYERRYLCYMEGKIDGGIITKEIAILGFPVGNRQTVAEPLYPLSCTGASPD